MPILKSLLSASRSLKIRAAMAVGILILVTAGLLTIGSTLVISQGIEMDSADRQSTLIAQVADEIDEKFRLRRTALMRLAQDIGATGASQPERLQAMLEQHHSLDDLFSNLVIFDAAGETLANLDIPDSRRKLNVAKRDYFKKVMASRATVISQPIRSAITGLPVVVIVTPILSARGDVVAVLAGTIELGQDSFIKQLATTKIGKSGYFFLITTDGVFVSHPDQARILKNTKEVGAHSPSITLAFDGFQGTTHSWTDSGVEALFSFKHLASTDWIVVAAYPTKEAFALLEQVRSNAILVALGLSLLIAPLAWWIINRQLIPLQQLHDRMLHVHYEPESSVAPVQHRNDEIGDLARAFDELIENRQHTARELANTEKNLRMIADNLPALVGYVDDTEHFVFGNRRYEVLFDIPAEQLPGKSVLEVIGAEAYDKSSSYIHAALNGQVVRFERQVMRHGVQQWDRAAFIPDLNPAGHVDGYFLLVEDITELKATQLVSANSEKFIRAVTDNLPALVSFIDLEGRILFANLPHELWFDRPLSAITGQLISSLLSADEYALRWPYFEQAGRGQLVEFSFERAHAGLLSHYHARYTPQFDEQARIVGISCLINDITDAKLVEQQLSALARFDTLTGLPNRHQLNERIAQAVERSARSQRQIALMYLDIDKFKSINDSLGHHGGDEVLKQFALRIKSCARLTDTVGRMAGDEFVILLEGLQHDAECTLVAQKIVQAMEQPFNIDGMLRTVTTSIGIAISHGQRVSPESMLKKADEALYRAKQAGRNTYVSMALSGADALPVRLRDSA